MIYALHRGEILPEILETICAAEQGCKMCRIHQQDVAGPIIFWRHPEQDVELGIPRRRKRMRPLEVNGLLSEQMYRSAIRFLDRVMRQVRMKVECCDVV